MEILRLIIFSLRPLTTHELLDLMASSVMWGKTSIPRLLQTRAIPSWLPGMLTVYGNEVCLSHRHLCDFILAGNGSETGVNIGESECKVHGQIANLCLKYLLSSHSQPLLERYLSNEPEAVAGPESRLNFR